MSPLQRTRTIGNGDGWDRTRSGLLVPDWADVDDCTLRPQVDATVLGIDLFAGAGGFSCGMHMAGIHVIAANENDVDASHTYLCNLGSPDTRVVFCTPDDEQRWHKGRRKLQRYHEQQGTPPLEFGSGWISGQPHVKPCEVFFFGDICALTGGQLLVELGLDGDDIGVVFGGPPCQGFSRAGDQDPNDPRNELVFEFMRVVCEIQPRAFVMENVPAMLNMVTRDGIPVIDALAEIAQEGGMGTFDSVRRSLLETAGAGAALRNPPKIEPLPDIGGDDDDDDEDEQLSLLEAAT